MEIPQPKIYIVFHRNGSTMCKIYLGDKRGGEGDGKDDFLRSGDEALLAVFRDHAGYEVKERLMTREEMVRYELIPAPCPKCDKNTKLSEERGLWCKCFSEGACERCVSEGMKGSTKECVNCKDRRICERCVVCHMCDLEGCKNLPVSDVYHGAYE